MKTVSETVRNAILDYPSAYRLARECGIERSTLSRFVNGRATLTLATLDALAPVLGLKVVRAESTSSATKATRGKSTKKED